MPGQPALGDKVFGIDADAIVVTDPEGEPSPYIIESGDPFTVELRLRFGGRLARWILCCLRWRICYCFGPLCGPGHGKTICTNYYDGRTDKLEYAGADTRLQVAARSLQQGTYRITAVVEFYWKHPCRPPIGRPPISAFADGPPIEILQVEAGAAGAAAPSAAEAERAEAPAETA